MRKLFGSFNNRMMENSKQPTPEIGMGATVTMYTDRHACTIMKVNAKGNEVEIIEDIATRTDENGMSDQQSYSYLPNPNRKPDTFSKRKNGMWVKVGSETKDGPCLIIGVRDHYHDFSF